MSLHDNISLTISQVWPGFRFMARRKAAGSKSFTFFMKSFCGGSRGTYSAVLRNTHGDDTLFEASYAVLALQMLPHAVGFSRKELPWPPEAACCCTRLHGQSVDLPCNHGLKYFYREPQHGARRRHEGHEYA
jgi:hypothetical protein